MQIFVCEDFKLSNIFANLYDDVLVFFTKFKYAFGPFFTHLLILDLSRAGMQLSGVCLFTVSVGGGLTSAWPCHNGSIQAKTLCGFPLSIYSKVGGHTS